MKPPIPITDRRFEYTPSYETDLRKKFAKMKSEREQHEARERAGIVTIPKRRQG